MCAARRLAASRQRKKASSLDVAYGDRDLLPVPAGSSEADSMTVTPPTTGIKTSNNKRHSFKKVAEAAVNKRRGSGPQEAGQEYSHVVSNWAKYVGYPMQYLLLVSIQGQIRGLPHGSICFLLVSRAQYVGRPMQ